MAKYELVKDDTVRTWDGRTLFRIKALVAIGLSVEAGDLGGYIESESNLAQVYGDAWVSGNALVYGNARVSGDAWVYGNARVSGDAWVSGNALVYGNAQVSGNAQVYGNARVSGNAQVYGNASRSPITITGLEFNITIDDTHMTAGCQSHRLEDWAAFDAERVKAMGGEEFMHLYGETLRQIAIASGRLAPVEQAAA